MRNILIVCILFVGILIPTACYCSIGKTIVEPHATSTLADIDARLEQKVTYNGGYKRLHTVVDDLSQVTGVKITAGSNSKDWQIRDIPVVVYVKDLPLGVLLNAIAESTHTSITFTKIEATKDKAASRVYRLYRPKKIQDTIDNCNKIAHERQLEEIDWAWDALLQMLKLPRSQQNQVTGRISTPIFAQIIAALGTDAKTKIMNGETITIQAADPKYASLMANLCNAHWEDRNEGMQTPLEKPTQEQIEALSLTIKLRDGGEGGNTDIVASSDMMYGTIGCPYSGQLRMSAARLEKVAELNLPPRPKGDYIIDPSDDCPRDKKLIALDLDKKNPSEVLDVKIKAFKPKESEPFRHAEFLAELAKSTGFNIVSEDFLSHSSASPNFTDALNHDTTLIKALKTTWGMWFVNENSKLLVGWASPQGWWVKSHKNLVQESMVTKLIAKQDAGVDLDDILPILDLTESQRIDWFYNNNDMWRWVLFAFKSEKPLWRLYHSLSPGEKDLAITSGFPLGRLGPVRVSDFLKYAYASADAEAFVPIKSESAESFKTLLDPDMISRAVMHLRRTPAAKRPSYGKVNPGKKPYWVSDLHYSYALEITCEEDNSEKVLCTAELGISLPVYSAELEERLAQEYAHKVLGK